MPESPFTERSYPAKDSLDCGSESRADARDCLSGLKWDRQPFSVDVLPPLPGFGDALIRFPSPVRTGNAENDRVALEWYAARDDQDRPVRAPAVVVVHESGRRMTVGRLFARGFQQRGIHGFLLHLPNYGQRRDDRRKGRDDVISSIRQAVADVRRARDAVAVLPAVDAGSISLQGTSLGGFVSATAAGLDRGYHAVFLMLAGGDLYDMLQNGQRDAAKVRQRLEEAGITGEQLRKLVYQVEPNRIAHRYDIEHTWLYSAERDTVVPLRNARSLAASAGLPESHHIRMNADHYSGIIYLPFVLNHMADRIADLRKRQ